MAKNPGKTNLISWWAFDEASGNAVDSHGANHLTETSGTIASAAGKVGNARDIEADDTEWFEIADNASLSLGADTAFSFFGWINVESVTARRVVLSKNDSGGSFGGIEYWMEIGTSRRLYCIISNGATYTTVTTTNTISTGTFAFIHYYHDPISNVIGASINAAAPKTAAWSGGTFNGANSFNIGRTSAGLYYDGLVDEFGFYKDRFLSTDEIDWLYNSGNGREYSNFASFSGSSQVIIF